MVNFPSLGVIWIPQTLTFLILLHHLSASQLSSYRETSSSVKGIVQGLTSITNTIAQVQQSVVKAERANGLRVSSPSSVKADEVFRGLEEDFARGYLFSGEINPSLYSDNCLFQDPTLSFTGLQTFQKNIASLKPLIERFVGANAVVLYSLVLSDTKDSIKASWRMIGALNLPWAPRIDIEGETVYTLSSESGGRIISYSESWKCPPAEALLQIVLPAKSDSADIKSFTECASITERFGAVSVESIKREIASLVPKADSGISQNRRRIRELTGVLERIATESKSSIGKSRKISGEWDLMYTDSDGPSSGKFGSIRAKVIQGFLPKDNNLDGDKFYNEASIGFASIKLEAMCQLCSKSLGEKFIVDFNNIRVQLFGLTLLSKNLTGQRGFWKMLYADETHRIFTTNTGKLFILVRKK